MFSKKIAYTYINKERKKQPFRSELFNIDQLGEYAKLLAGQQQAGPGTPNTYLRERLSENEEVLHRYNKEVLSEKAPSYITPATEWLVDNFYLIEEHIQLARTHFPKSYNKKIPSLTEGPYKNFPRIYAIAVAYVSHVDAQIDEESLRTFFQAYQQVTPLKLGELWAIPVMLRLILIENLRRITVQLRQDKQDRDLANSQMDEVEEVNSTKPSELVKVISRMSADDLPLSSAYVSEFSKRLSAHRSSLKIVKNWFEQCLQEEGLSGEELIHIENQHQAADQVSVSHSIKSLRFINSLDWREFIEQISLVENILRSDPVRLYREMDFISRDHYRHQVEKLAQDSRFTEEEVARRSIGLANAAVERDAEKRQMHVGYYLIDDGLEQLTRELGLKKTLLTAVIDFFKTYPLTFYTGTIGVVALLGTWLFIHLINSSALVVTDRTLFVVGLCLFIFLSQFAVFLVNYLSTLFIRPDFLPRLDFSAGIPRSCRTIFVVPAMIMNKAGIDKLVSDMELHYLSNPDGNLAFALLTDFADADNEHEVTDNELLAYSRLAVEGLNKKYNSGNNTVFYMLHRPRQWNQEEGKWMGYERKRGKLMAFNSFLLTGSTGAFSFTVGALDSLADVRYVITLDADTQLPPYSAYKLIGSMAHILNHPVIDPERDVVVKGYGIMQPRVAINLRSSRYSYYSRLFTNEVGIDPYTRTVSDVYQDIFHAGSFVGKGIYEVETFERVLSGRFPENHILSHDLLESAYVHSGLVTDVEMYESYPGTYLADAKRRHRWMRGDWQIMPWLFPQVPLLEGKEENPLSGLSKWKIADNLRRSLVSPLTLLFLLGSFAWFPQIAWIALLLVAIVSFLPFAITFPVSLFKKPKEEPWLLHLKSICYSGGHQLNQVLFTIATFPFEAYLCTDAMIRSLWRIAVSRRHLLQWQTAEEADRNAVNDLPGVYRQMWFSPVFALLCVGLLWSYPETFFYTLPFMLGWLVIPYIVWYISQPLPQKKSALTEKENLFLRKLTRKIWYFFETFVNEQEHYLPPDNFQERPVPVIAKRTSPTNIGLSLLANVSAYDFGYLSMQGVIERTTNVFLTLTSLKKYRGHFYNWYDTRTLEPLYPLYISTVDSGNLVGNFITLSCALKEFISKPVYDPVIFEGLLDTVKLAQEYVKSNATLKELEVLLTEQPEPETLPAAYARLQDIRKKIDLLEGNSSLEKSDVGEWVRALSRTCNSHMDELLFLYPWLTKDWQLLLENMEEEVKGEDWFTYLSTLFTTIPSLEEMVTYDQALCKYQEELIKRNSPAQEDARFKLYSAWIDDFKLSAYRAKERIRILTTLSYQCDSFSRMDFRFLYKEKKRLFTIGYNVMEQKYDASLYDMLASEARLCSYITIAQGQVPIEHWFALSRLITLIKGRPVLLSWSGSMFEYLMPLLLMPGFEQTLLEETYRGVVDEQISYGNKLGIPWGISESGYNRPDTQFNYQYRAFGVPSLGLKRGLSKDLVIAPYATQLALMIDPVGAYENLQRLTAGGHEGKYGYYEAIDYTPSHLPINEKKVNIYSFMAHHQGMSLLSLTNLLKAGSMQKRFISTPQMKAFELLLQERIPHSVTTNVINEHAAVEMQNIHAFQSGNSAVNRIFSGETNAQEINLLSNGRYQLVVNTTGGGYSRWNNLAVTRWRQDPTSDINGLFIYMRDVKNGRYWSATFQPAQEEIRDYEVQFTQAYAEFRQRHTGLDITTTVCVSPEDDVELRCVKLTNHSHKTREIELTTYGEVVIAPQGADEAHPVFSNLFVQTRFDAPTSTLFCTRRASSEHEQPPHLFHLMLVDHTDGGKVSFETDRSRFVGRGNTLVSPQVMQTRAPLSGSEGAVLDPIIALRRTVSIPPGSSVRVCIALGMAATHEAIVELAEKYQNIRMTDRAFELAWTHSQVVLYHLNIREAEAQLYQKLAGVLIYMNPSFRAEPAILNGNRKGQNGLWGYGISGDVPFVLVRISKDKGIELVRQLVLAHAYWRLKGLAVEMLILNEDESVYRQPIHDEIINLIATGVEAAWLDKSGGIMVRPIEHVPNEDLVLLQAAASAIFSDKQGELAEQLRKIHLSLSPVAPLSPVPVFRPEVKTVPVPYKTVNNNGYGGFSQNGKEYIINLAPGQNTPAPWSNVIANPVFGTVVSEGGGSYTWSENSHEYRLTPWYNDPVKDTSGEAIYIRDEESGRYWSPTPLPARGTTPYTIRHGFGYTVFEHTEDDIQSELWIYVAIDAPVKFSVLKLRNLSSAVRDISVTGYYEWVLGDTRTRNMLHVATYVDKSSGVLYARNYYNTDFAGKIPFVDAGSFRAVTGDRKEFLGVGGTLAAPLAMARKRLSGKTGAGFDPCGAVQVKVELRPGQDKEIPFLLGCADSEEDMLQLVNRYRQPGAVREALVHVRDYWKRTLSTIEIETPDTAVNFMANGWLLYQTLSCRIWGRSGYYQSGGAYGFRDQLQDVMALVNAEPAITRQQILLAARHQFKKGDVMHWWHPPTGRGVRTRFSDDYLWLPYVTHRYVSAVGDTGILNERVPFIEGRELNPGEESYYDQPLVSDESATLYEHCVRSIRYGLKFGSHGLPLMGCGDWNDGMNLVGIEGKGESVWLAFFLYDVLMKFSGIAATFNDPEFAEYCLEQARQLRENIRMNAWDGNWYLRAYFDDGTLMGSSTDSECMIDLLPQSWSVISGAGDPERSHLGMENVEHYLVDRKNKMIKLFTPAFDKFTPSPGYIKGYVPGVRENGGQYTHGVIWCVLAFAMRGETEKAWELFDLLNPIHHGSTEEEVNVYKAEPYVVAADVYSASQHLGRAGWSWYTGSSSWMYRLLVETLLGINRVGEQLELSPRMRKAWNEYTVTYRYYATTYRITFKRNNENVPSRLLVDGKTITANPHVIQLINDRQEHTVEMWI